MKKNFSEDFKGKGNSKPKDKKPWSKKHNKQFFDEDDIGSKKGRGKFFDD